METIKKLYDAGIWWLFLGSLVSADLEEGDRGKALDLLKELIIDIPNSDLPEDVKERSLEICTSGIEIIKRDIIL